MPNRRKSPRRQHHLEIPQVAGSRCGGGRRDFTRRSPAPEEQAQRTVLKRQSNVRTGTPTLFGRAAIYARISPDKVGEAVGAGRQIDSCRQLAELQDWSVNEVHIDEVPIDDILSAHSGARRPEYERLLDLVRQGARVRPDRWTDQRQASPERGTRQRTPRQPLLRLRAATSTPAESIRCQLRPTSLEAMNRPDPQARYLAEARTAP